MVEDSESNAVLGFVVGAIVVAALVFVFFVVVPNSSSPKSDPGNLDVKIEIPNPAPDDPGSG